MLNSEKSGRNRHLASKLDDKKACEDPLDSTRLQKTI